jgi:hypothetical protein
MNIEEMNLQELEEAINARKARLSEEGVSEEERAQIEIELKDLSDRLEIVSQEVWQAMRRGAELPPAPMPY